MKPFNYRNTLTACSALLRRSKFWHREDGSMTIFGLFMFLGIIAVIGIGVDVMRYERDRVHLQNTLDRAVLAAADLDQPLEPTAVVQDYFAKAGLSESLTGVTPVEALGSRQVTASAEMSVDTFFMQMFGVEQLDIESVSAAEESVPNVEISLVLDISGSMRFSNRMAELRPAARSFVSKVLSGNASGGTSGGTGTETVTTVNVVPYAGHVNPGPEMFEYLDGRRFGTSENPVFDEWQQDISNVAVWFDLNGNGEVDSDDTGEGKDFSAKIEGYPNGDVEGFNKNNLNEYYDYVVSHVKREAARQGNPVPEGAAALGASIKGGKQDTTFFYSETGESILAPNDFWQKTDMTIQFNDFYNDVMPNWLSSCKEMESVDFTHSQLPVGTDEQVGHFMKWTIAPDVMDWGWCPSDQTAIQYAQLSESALHTYIDNIRMHDGTGTFYGMKWALALLDPSSSAAFSHLNTLGLVPDGVEDRPSTWTDPDTTKYIVLMTDGQITDQYRAYDKLDPVHATVEFDNQSGSPDFNYSPRSTNLSRFYAQCDLAKDNGVVVFTIAFDAPSGARTEMQNCASSPSHFFEVANGDLNDAFTAIASQINKLRLTQ